MRAPTLIPLVVAGIVAAAGSAVGRAPAETFVAAPPPIVHAPPRGRSETAVFAGGCFWGVEAVFAHVKGVRSAVSGYAGGSASSASYGLVATGQTAHAEAVKVVFDPRQVSYADLLRVYFSVVADPTRLNAQGPDHGPQYRSALFPASPAQAQVARAYIGQLTRARTFPRPIVTRIERAGAFYPAEEHHQDFMAKNPAHPYIVVNDAPKVEALRRTFPALYRR